MKTVLLMSFKALLATFEFFLETFKRLLRALSPSKVLPVIFRVLLTPFKVHEVTLKVSLFTFGSLSKIYGDIQGPFGYV